ncbi:MAG: tRNA (adenosine(37)-N6)-dimethylallyltransferase MiaA [Desulfobacteraceae bacterium]|nr:tRNA (adenosine(37)-N6)-dimethylallyltransferase MiaA [Desulfobacteraceae bacterium]
MPRPKIVVICGPTGIGKTRLSLALARKLNGGIVSADSMQIYRYMDIGTAKPDAAELATAPHYMINVADPDEPYDAARYAEEARDAVAGLEKQNKLPLIIGGTGLYIKALLHGLFQVSPSRPQLRQRLRSEAGLKGSRYLHDRLAACDPEAAGRIHPNDTYRIIRALEVYQVTGRPISEYQQNHGFADSPFCALKIGLCIERQELYERINRRVEKMIAGGLLNEVRGLLEKGYGPELKPMQSLGYRHMTDYLHAKLSWQDAVDQMKRDTRRYAKRQLVWFRKDPEIIWTSPDDLEGIGGRIEKFLSPGK